VVNIVWAELLVVIAALTVLAVLAGAAFAPLLPVVRRSPRPVLPPSPLPAG
jgi:hypothetical protein